MSDKDAKNRALDKAGELFVLKLERRLLERGNRPDLAAKVRHVSEAEGAGAGYDIESYALDGSPRKIKVKTTCAAATTPLFMTAKEAEFARLHSASYLLYRVYDFNQQTQSGNFFVIKGDPRQQLISPPTKFGARH